jgi:hypothetical protein
VRYGHLMKPSEERGTLHLIALSLSRTFIIAICHFVLVVSTHDVTSSTEAFISISRRWSAPTQAKGCTGRAHWNATRSIDSPSYCTHKAIGTEYNGRHASSICTFSRLKKQAYSKVLSALWKVARNIFFLYNEENQAGEHALHLYKTLHSCSPSLQLPSCVMTYHYIRFVSSTAIHSEYFRTHAHNCDQKGA